jgi:hypothetical protein
MGMVGSLPLPSENNNVAISDVTNDNHTQSSPHHQISHAHLCMKELQSVAARLEKQRCLKNIKYDGEKTIKHDFRCEKHRQRPRTSKSKHSNIQDQLKNKIQQLEFQQTRLLSTITQLDQYKQDLEVVCQQINSNNEHLQ